MIKVFTKDYHLTMKVKRAFNGMVVEFFTKEVNSEI